MSIFQKFFHWVTSLFAKGSEFLENTFLPATIAVTNALKFIVDTDTPDIIGHIAGAAGAKLEDKVRDLLAKIVPKLQLAQQWKGQDPNTILANIIKLIGDSDVITKTAFWVEFSGMLANAFEDGKIDLGEATALAKYFYANHADVKPVGFVPVTTVPKTPAPEAPIPGPDGNTDTEINQIPNS